jgi:lipopolysaccharide cholinephosphotransferase
LNSILNTTELKLIELEILKEFAKFCEDHNLRYYLAYGTLLGAVRHQGFIPWDDDIDVIMPRPDYTRFLKLTKNSMGENLRVLSSFNEPDTIYPFAKVVDTRTTVIETTIRLNNPLGVWIDVFPMDGIPEDKKEVDSLFLKMKIYQQLLYLSIAKITKGKNMLTTLLKCILIPPARLLNYRYIIQKIEQKAQQYEFDNCDYTAVLVGVYGQKEVVLREEYIKPVKMIFEGEYFYVPSNYHEHLTSLYEDYMQPPPVKNRISTHTMKVYWK